MSSDIHTVFVGYDSREDIAYKVCEYSIYKHCASAEVIPLVQSDLRREGVYNRQVDSLSSTEFTFTRFLVPYLNNYTGWALFCDCDFVWDGNIEELFEKADKRYAVMVVKHDHKPTNTVKMDGKQQTQYPRKNWSSMILWNCEHPSNAKITPELINNTTGQFLHRFEWLRDDEIGDLNLKYNFLVGYNDPNIVTPFAYHYTEGGPWFKEYTNCPFNNVWMKYLIEYADYIGRDHTIQRTPITWVTSLSRSYYEEVAQYTLPTWKNLPGDVVFIWDDKPVDIGIGRIFSFWKDVASPDDPWMKEGMGGTKADRFWKKSRAQIWATRKFKGLVVWIDADISITRSFSRQKAIDMLHPKQNMWASLDGGIDWGLPDDCPIDTGVVAFDTKKQDFEKFIRDYSLIWYNGIIHQLPQPYDHHAANHVRVKWDMTNLCPPRSAWKNQPTEYISRYCLENSILSEFMIHHLGIDNKAELVKEKKKKTK